MYCTIQQIKDALHGVDDVDYTIWTDQKITTTVETMAQPYFENVLCGRSFENASYTELLDGNGRYDILPSFTPITEVSEIKIDGETLDLDVENVYTYRTRIALDRSFPVGRQNVEITYKAGFTKVPDEVAMAVALLAAMYITVVSETSANAIETGITAGPISLRESFAFSGKYANKTTVWSRFVRETAKANAKSPVVNRIRGVRRSKEYAPRMDRWV